MGTDPSGVWLPLFFGLARWLSWSVAGFTVATVKNSVASAKRLTAKQRAARDQRVVDWFLAGLSHRQVAAKAGISHTMVQKIVRRDLEERMEQRGAVGEAMVLAQRQNELLRAHWDGALGGDVQSARIVLQLLRMQEKAVERARIDAIVDVEVVVDAELVDDEPQQRAIAEARQLRVVPPEDEGLSDDGSTDLLSQMRRARAGDANAQEMVDAATGRVEYWDASRREYLDSQPKD